jgi:hypothetical protein
MASALIRRPGTVRVSLTVPRGRSFISGRIPRCVWFAACIFGAVASVESDATDVNKLRAMIMYGRSSGNLRDSVGCRNGRKQVGNPLHDQVRRPFQADTGVRPGYGPSETFNVRLADFVIPASVGTNGLTGARVRLESLTNSSLTETIARDDQVWTKLRNSRCSAAPCL